MKCVCVCGGVVFMVFFCFVFFFGWGMGVFGFFKGVFFILFQGVML